MSCWRGQCILEEDELCSRSASGLLKLQQTIWRINRSISRCSSLTEALEAVNEMKAAGINAANEGTNLLEYVVYTCQQVVKMHYLKCNILSRSISRVGRHLQR